jgi:ribonuclease Z
MTRHLLVATAILACATLPAIGASGDRADGNAHASAASLRLSGRGAAIAGASQSAAAMPPADTMKVVLLGTGAGPAVNLQQYGASILVEAGGQRLLFDCGRGTTLRLAQAGVPVRSITRVFLTHLHSDHVVQLPDLLLTGWAGGRAVPLEVWGPVGTRAMMTHLQEAFAFDIEMRRDVDEHFPAAGITVVSHEVTADTVVFSGHGATVTAFAVDHGLVRPAFGYRVDYAGHSVVLSGDTRVTENLVRHAQGVDVLVHEAIDPQVIRDRPDHPSAAIIDAIVAHHTTPQQAGEVFRRVAPRLAVYSHAPNTERILAQTRMAYAGPLEGAEDLLTIFVGTQITVVHHPAPQR